VRGGGQGVRDERRWEIARQIHQDAGLTGRYDGLTPIEDVFTADEIREFDRRIGPPVPVEGLRWAEFVSSR
jgi:manganese/zinc/iron transport system permease protein